MRNQYIGDATHLGINPARELANSPIIRIVGLLVAHVALIIVIDQHWSLATLHVFVVTLLGLYFLLFDKSSERLIYVVGYIVASGLVWRITDARVFHEFGKYATVFFLGASLIKEERILNVSKIGLIYFALLVPSIALLPQFDQGAISFNLSGPLALAVATLYFSKKQLTLSELQKLLLFMILPIVGLAGLANFDILLAGGIVLQKKATSAGFNPNQVSALFGLGSVLAFQLATISSKRSMVRVLMFIIALALSGQAILTFSRGGFWNGLLAICVGVFFQARARQARASVILSLILGLIVFSFVLLPSLDRLSDGFFTERISDFDLTGRDDIWLEEWRIFLENPVAGVGPGEAEYLYNLDFIVVASHTEYTRMLAEHGLLGGISLLLLLYMAAQFVLTQQSSINRSFSAAAVTYTLFFFVHAATRLAAPSFLFGLAAIHIIENASEKDGQEQNKYPLR